MISSKVRSFHSVFFLNDQIDFLYKVEKGGVRSSRFDFLTIERFASFDVSIFLFTKKARPFFVLKNFFLKSPESFLKRLFYFPTYFLFRVPVKKICALYYCYKIGKINICFTFYMYVPVSHLSCTYKCCFLQLHSCLFI